MIERGTHPKWSSGFVTAKPECGRCRHPEHRGPCIEYVIRRHRGIIAHMEQCKCVTREEP